MAIGDTGGVSTLPSFKKLKQIIMARQTEENSKIGKVKILQVNESVTFEDDKWSSLTVQVSNLRKDEQHKDKKFKVSHENGNTIVKRVL